MTNIKYKVIPAEYMWGQSVPGKTLSTLITAASKSELMQKMKNYALKFFSEANGTKYNIKEMKLSKELNYGDWRIADPDYRYDYFLFFTEIKEEI